MRTKTLLGLLLLSLTLAAEEPPRLKGTDELTAKVPVIFYDLRYGQLASGIKECREIALVKPGPVADFRVFIRRRPYPSNLMHWLKVDYAGMTILESHDVMKPKNVVKDACQAVLGLARSCEDCWALYDRNGKAVKIGQPPPERSKE